MKFAQILPISFFFFFSFVSFSQETKQLTKEDKLQELIQIKKQLTNSDQLKEFYKIQLYSGSLKEAEEIKQNFDKAFNLASTIKYETPNYKVWIGNFRTRLEADRAMLQIEELFEKAFIIRPGRS